MKRLLGVGINKFMDPGASLNGCVNDVATVRSMCVSKLGMDPKEIRLLCDERATRLGIFQRLDWCARGWPETPTLENDQLVIQFSCHGSQVVDRDGDEVADRQDEILCPYNFPELWDSPTGAPDADECAKILGRAPRPGICDDDLAVFLKEIPKGIYTVLIVDACHSGSIDRGLIGNPHPAKARFIAPPFDIASRGLDRELTINRLGKSNKAVTPDSNVHYSDQRHILISGCRDNQTSADAYLDGRYQGAMTCALNVALTALKFGTGGKPTWLEVHAYMLQWLTNSGYEQVPQLTGPKAWLEAPVFLL